MYTYILSWLSLPLLIVLSLLSFLLHIKLIMITILTSVFSMILIITFITTVIHYCYLQLLISSYVFTYVYIYIYVYLHTNSSRKSPSKSFLKSQLLARKFTMEWQTKRHVLSYEDLSATEAWTHINHMGNNFRFLSSWGTISITLVNYD